MPDIDIDFDDEGRQRVIDYVVDKYTKEQVAQIVTFGTMAAKSSIRDVARVLQLPLPEADKLAKLVPDEPGISLERAFKEVPELGDFRKKGSELTKKTLDFAHTLEGSVRHTGIHAAGIIIAPDNLMNHIPVCKQKDSDLLVTQYEGKHIEDAGMLKMDFLGLKTLSIIKDAVINVKRSHGVDIVPDDIPLDDEKTLELFQRGDTVGIFQFESVGMRTYLKELKPTSIEDLIAMNALYRPGPMDYIPEFVNRKHGKSEVTYPHEWLEEILEPTYGIMVYQEQIMQAAQIMAGFSLGAADILRRAMGKKKAEVMEEQKKIFVEGAVGKGVEREQADEIFTVMAKFASYGFNRSHSAAYSVLAFQTAYLKAHYPAEFIAAVLTHNMNDIKQVNFFMREASRLSIPTLGPDVNESEAKFVVNHEGAIRFGLTAVKGVGGAAVEHLIEEREKKGSFASLFDLTRRVGSKAVNRKCIESLVLGGAFDRVGDMRRSQYFAPIGTEGMLVIEKAIKLGNAYQATLNSSQNSLFGEDTIVEAQLPDIPDIPEWDMIELLTKEKEVTGIYISGHPLDDYELELKNFCVAIEHLPKKKNKQATVGGIVSKVEHRVSKKGNRFALFHLEDFTGTAELALFGEDYLKWKHFLEPGELLFVKGTYQPRYNAEDMFELRISDIKLLREAKDKIAKQLTLEFGISDISSAIVDDMVSVVQNNPGDCEVKFKLTDVAEKYSVDMASTSYKVNLNEEVKAYLNSLPTGTFKLKQGT
jgi:DNA polymerase-3 subunit alpha